MKFYLKLASWTLGLATVFSASLIPSVAAVENPYGVTSVGCITNISMKEYTPMEGVNYFEADVTSYIQGVLSGEENTYATYGAIGTRDARLFAYSYGDSSDLNYANHTVADIMKKFEEDNPGWKAIVGINGDFFDIETSKTADLGEPQGPSVSGGKIYKAAYSGYTGRGLIGVTTDGTVLYEAYGKVYDEMNFGTNEKFGTADKFEHTIGVLGEHKTNAVIEFSSRCSSYLVKNEISFSTPNSGIINYVGRRVAIVKCDSYRYSHTVGNGNENGLNGIFAEGEVVEIRDGISGDIVPEGYIYIALNDSINVNNNIKVGSYLRIQRSVNDEWKNIESAVAFHAVVLVNGTPIIKNAYGEYNTSGDKEETAKWTDDLTDYTWCWRCRTAIGLKEDGTPVFLVTDKGSNGNLAAGYYELGEQLKALGCTNGFLLDGGGSSTFTVRNEDGTFSNTFCGENGTKGRAVGNAVIMAVRDESVPLPENDPLIEPVAEPTEETDSLTDIGEETAATTDTTVTDISDEEEKGFFEAIFDAIAEFFQGIVDFFKNLFGGTDKNTV